MAWGGVAWGVRDTHKETDGKQTSTWFMGGTETFGQFLRVPKIVFYRDTMELDKYYFNFNYTLYCFHIISPRFIEIKIHI